MTTYSCNVTGGVTAVNNNEAQMLTSLQRLVEFLHGRCQMEEQNHKQYHKLGRIPIDNFVVGGDINSTLGSVRAVTQRSGDRRLRFARDVMECVCVPMQNLCSEMNLNKKRLMATAQRLEKDYGTAVNAVQKAKQKQLKLAKDAEQAYAKKQRLINSRPTFLTQLEHQQHVTLVEHLTEKSDQAIRDSNLADEQYKESVRNMQLYKISHAQEIQSIMNAFYQNDKEMVTMVKNFVLLYISTEEMMIMDTKRELEDLRGIVEGLDVNRTMDTFVERMPLQDPEEIKYDPYTPVYDPNVTAPPPTQANKILSFFTDRTKGRMSFLKSTPEVIEHIDEIDVANMNVRIFL
jgi:hypothetical protein